MAIAAAALQHGRNGCRVLTNNAKATNLAEYLDSVQFPSRERRSSAAEPACRSKVVKTKTRKNLGFSFLAGLRRSHFLWSSFWNTDHFGN